MIPLRDDAPRSTTPFINYFLIVLNTIIFLFEWSLPPRVLTGFVYQFGFTPTHVNAWLTGQLHADAVVIPLFTSMFLHASWLHLIFNMWFLWIFGDNVEDRLGHFKYLVFYLLSGLGADFTHYLLNINSDIPSLGASGAIAGVLGAYFLLFPSARVFTWVFGIFFFWLPAWLWLGLWFVGQFLSGAATAITYSHETGGGVAVWAHVGGFIAGMLLIKIFPARARYYSYEG
jgi:rhomboid family protein